MHIALHLHFHLGRHEQQAKHNTLLSPFSSHKANNHNLLQFTHARYLTYIGDSRRSSGRDVPNAKVGELPYWLAWMFGAY
jgi:hypothetical protein